MRKINKPSCPNPSALMTNYKHPDNKSALVDASFGKCVYCESKVTHIYFGDIEHIKPKSKYPDLEYDWSNLGFICAICNNAKGDKYDESTPYLNPYEEDPCNFLIVFGTFLKHKQGNERAELTITDIALNRPDLLEKRFTRIGSIEKAIDACYKTQNETLRKYALSALKHEGDEDKEYSFFIKTFLESHGLI